MHTSFAKLFGAVSLLAVTLSGQPVQASERPSDESIIEFANSRSECGVKGGAFEVYAVSATDNTKSTWIRYRSTDGNTYISTRLRLVKIEGDQWLAICGSPMGKSFYSIID